MLPLTTIGLMRVMDPSGQRQARAVEVAAEFIGPLNAAMVKWDITTDARIAAFLAQAMHESAEFTRLEENLNYSAEALVRVWPKRFTLEEAQACAHKPELIANRVYADRLGNADAASGEGWLYRGRGLFQITGKDNYRHCSIAIAGDADTLLMNPELLASTQYACESAGWFWNARGLSDLADRGGFEEITRKINGGINGLVDRVAYWHRAIAMLA